jgi:hypothetical protein
LLDPKTRRQGGHEHEHEHEPEPGIGDESRLVEGTRIRSRWRDTDDIESASLLLGYDDLSNRHFPIREAFLMDQKWSSALVDR